MAEYTFFFNPMSRAQIARWALHEAAVDYEPVFVPFDNPPAALMAANSLGKLPTVVHHHAGHDHVVTEAAAICHYLAEMSAPELLPRAHEKADYFRWMFFAAGPLEQAVTARMFGWELSPDQERSAGFGSYERALDAIAGWLADRDHVCGERFTMADVYVGSAIDWGLQFGSIPPRDVLEAYAARCRERPAFREGKAIDGRLMAEMQGEGGAG